MEYCFVDGMRHGEFGNQFQEVIAETVSHWHLNIFSLTPATSTLVNRFICISYGKANRSSHYPDCIPRICKDLDGKSILMIFKISTGGKYLYFARKLFHMIVTGFYTNRNNIIKSRRMGMGFYEVLVAVTYGNILFVDTQIYKSYLIEFIMRLTDFLLLVSEDSAPEKGFCLR